jgi:uncharacterized protein YbcV (DUF1398 family)
MLLASQSKNHTAQEKRKKRKKKGQNLLYNNSHISLPQSHTVILSSNPRKKKENTMFENTKIQEAKELHLSLRKTALETPRGP